MGIFIFNLFLSLFYLIYILLIA